MINGLDRARSRWLTRAIRDCEKRDINDALADIEELQRIFEQRKRVVEARQDRQEAEMAAGFKAGLGLDGSRG